LRQESLDGRFLNAFLHAQFVVQEMIGKRSGSVVNTVNANAIPVSIGADQPYLQIGRRCPDDVGVHYHVIVLNEETDAAMRP
jgi:hypothetical protein